MKEIIKYAAANRISKGRNAILNKALEKELKEDKVVKILTKEVTEYSIRLLKIKKENKNSGRG